MVRVKVPPKRTFRLAGGLLSRRLGRQAAISYDSVAAALRENLSLMCSPRRYTRLPRWSMVVFMGSPTAVFDRDWDKLAVMRWSHRLTIAMLVWFVHSIPSLAKDDSKAPAKDAGRLVEQSDATMKVITSNGGVGTAPVLISRSELNTCVESPAGTITGQEKPTVVLLKIDSARVPLAASIATSSGLKELDRRIPKCYRKTRYQPGLVDGRPASADMEIQLKWDSYLPQTTCSASTRVRAILRFGVKPSLTEPEALPPTGQAILWGSILTRREHDSKLDPVHIVSRA